MKRLATASVACLARRTCAAPRPRLAAAAIAIGSLICVPGLAAQCDTGSGGWSVGIGQQTAGPAGTVYAVAEWDPDGDGPLPVLLVAAGSFRVAGAALVNNIATWDGAAWRPIGLGFNQQVKALAIDNGQLFAAGDFSASGGVALAGVATWTGDAWNPVGLGVNGSVNALAVYNGRLYAGGEFTMAGGLAANRIASWDGSAWAPLAAGVAHLSGTTGPPPDVRALEVFDGHLIVGGLFGSASGVPQTESLARWNGTAWSSLGRFLDAGPLSPLAVVNCLDVHASDAAAGATLYVGGKFLQAGGVDALNVASYPVTPTGSGPWSALGGGIPVPVTELLVHPQGTSAHAVLANTLTQSGVAWPGGVYSFTSGGWSQYGPEQATCLGSHFGVVAGVNGLARRVGSDWLPFGNGLNGPIRAIASLNGALHAFGNFTIADQQFVNGAARLDESGWRPVGSGVLVPGGLTSVLDAEILGSQIFVAGEAVDLDGQIVLSILRWDGAAWNNTNMLPPVPTVDLERLGADMYLTAGSGVYRWQGPSWTRVGQPLTDIRLAGVVWWADELHAFGAQLYRFDGAVWHVAAQNPNPFVSPTSALVWNGRLFFAAGSRGGSGSILEVVGSSFITSGPDLLAADLIDFNDDPVALTSNGLAAFDGMDWSIVAETISFGEDLSLHEGELIATCVDGAGNTALPAFGRFTCCAADRNADGQVDVFDLLAYLDQWFAAAPTADLDGSPGVDVFDLLSYLDAWFTGC